jgi:hypothetical protein
MQVTITVHFDKFVSHPYWPEREQVIQIQKESGVNRARSQPKREQALSNHLAKLGMSMEQYTQLITIADRPFHLSKGGLIVIPAHNLYGCFAQASDLATSSIRLASPEQIRTVLHTSDWATDKSEQDSLIWKRFVVVKSGTGQALSNQRSLRENSYIEDFEAVGTLSFSTDILRPEKVHTFLDYAGLNIGVGASRKLDNGRFTIRKWEEEA